MLAANNGKFTIFKPHNKISLPSVNIDDVLLLSDINTAIKFKNFQKKFEISKEIIKDLQLYISNTGFISKEIYLFYPELDFKKCKITI